MNEFDPYLRWGPFRWPPKISTSIESGLIGYILVLMHIHGHTADSTAKVMAENYAAFWSTWGDTGLLIGFFIFAAAILYVVVIRFWSSWMAVGRMMG